MSYKNSVLLEGIICKQPEVRYFNERELVLNMTLQTSEEGEKIDSSVWEQWHKLRFENEVAILAEKMLKQGDNIKIEGRLVYLYEYNKQGDKHLQTLIIVRSFKVLSQTNDEKDSYSQAKKTQKQNINSSTWEEYIVKDEEDPMA